MDTLVSATELARRLGEYLARVRYRRESLLVEKNGRPVARVVPALNAEPVTLSRALALWYSAGSPDPSFADDLESVGASDRPPADPWD